MKRFVREHPASAAVMILLGLVIVILFVSVRKEGAEVRRLRDVQSLEGCYGTAPWGENGPGTVYFVFEKDGTYVRHRAGERPIEEGRYERNGEFVTLTDSNGSRELLIKADYLYDFERKSGQWCVYVRHPVVTVCVPWEDVAESTP